MTASPWTFGYARFVVVKSGERQTLIGVLLDAQRTGINRGTSGNASVRSTGGFIITPTSIPYDQMDPSDLVGIDNAGIASGLHRPSSEWLVHQRVYQHRDDVNAIVHLHSPSAAALSSLRLDIPPFHYMVAVAGGSDIRCADYATFGTDQAADAAIVALANRYACLLSNHGLIACGDTVRQAYNLAIEVESLAEQYLLARTAGEPVLLNDFEMTEVIANFHGVGEARPANN